MILVEGLAAFRLSTRWVLLTHPLDFFSVTSASLGGSDVFSESGGVLMARFLNLNMFPTLSSLVALNPVTGWDVRMLALVAAHDFAFTS